MAKELWINFSFIYRIHRLSRKVCETPSGASVVDESFSYDERTGVLLEKSRKCNNYPGNQRKKVLKIIYARGKTDSRVVSRQILGTRLSELFFPLLTFIIIAAYTDKIVNFRRKKRCP